MGLRIVEPYKAGTFFEHAGPGMDARFRTAAHPDARMIWSDGWACCGAAVFATPIASSTHIEVVRAQIVRPYIARVAHFDAVSGHAWRRDESFRATHYGSQIARAIKATFPGWALLWIGDGATTPVAILTQGEGPARRWAFVKCGPQLIYVAVDRILTTKQIVERAHTGH